MVSKRNVKVASFRNDETENKICTKEDEKIDKVLDETINLIKTHKNQDLQLNKILISKLIKSVQLMNERKQRQNEYRILKLIRLVFSCWDIILLTLLIILFSIYLIFFLNIYFSPNQKIKFNELNKNLTKLTNWLISKWMYLNGFTDLTKEECAVVAPDMFNSILRPIDDCSMCLGLKKIERITHIDKEEFLDKFAYTGVPVVISNAINHWPAMKIFNFEFLKELYLNMTETEMKKRRDNKINRINKNSIKNNQSMLMNTFNSLVEKDSERAKSVNFKDTCQFFPYKTKFKSLRQVFDMKKDENGKWKMPWYVGWSNCNNYASQIIRKHYERPEFLPDESEMSRLDWIFMGTPGYGAEMHIDDVHNPSWQAQITGVKHWTFRPPAECILKCKFNFEINVYPGDIIIFDSNRWFHSTLIIGDDLSLTIGSEYD